MAKKSRRARRQESSTALPEVNVAETPQSMARQAVDFVQEYSYVYKELRSVLLIAIVMFIVLFGLAYVI